MKRFAGIVAILILMMAMTGVVLAGEVPPQDVSDEAMEIKLHITDDGNLVQCPGGDCDLCKLEAGDESQATNPEVIANAQVMLAALQQELAADLVNETTYADSLALYELYYYGEITDENMGMQPGELERVLDESLGRSSLYLLRLDAREHYDIGGTLVWILGRVAPEQLGSTQNEVKDLLRVAAGRSAEVALDQLCNDFYLQLYNVREFVQKYECGSDDIQLQEMPLLDVESVREYLLTK